MDTRSRGADEARARAGQGHRPHGVLRLALEKGHSVVTSAVIDEAMDRFMPKSASTATKALAEAVALERAKSGPVSMCRACGVTATQSGAVKCTVCGATDFEVISRR